MKACIDCRTLDCSAAQRLPHQALHSTDPVGDMECAHTELWAPGWGTFRCSTCGAFFIRQSPASDAHPQWLMLPSA